MFEYAWSRPGRHQTSAAGRKCTHDAYHPDLHGHDGGNLSNTRLISDAVIRVVNVDTDALDGHGLASFGTTEGRTQMQPSNLPVMGLEGLQGPERGEQVDALSHLRPSFET